MKGCIFVMDVITVIKLPLYGLLFLFSSITYSPLHFIPNYIDSAATVCFIKFHSICSIVVAQFFFSEQTFLISYRLTFSLPLSFILLYSDMPKPPEGDVFILPDEYKFIPRNKRAVLMKNQHNQKLNVEMLVVVDRKMMDNHGHENITTYVLTVLNMVRTVLDIEAKIKTKICL